MKNFILFLGLFIFCGCVEELREIPDETIGMAPIYAVAEAWDEIVATEPRAIEQLGKIYYKDPYIYATERGEGIHVVDNSNPENPTRVAFLQIIGNSDLAIRGNTLYANNVNDLVAIDISNLDSVTVNQRLSGVFSNTGAEFPENYSGFFECADPEMGTVIGWAETTLVKPQCWR
ncbi:hypothetical protein CEQ90_16250 [Lewinellaceae bacterium SD302]|nr:hypothetical protein CEQ90_16250 [Lewinellaceae bacterium SD302]